MGKRQVKAAWQNRIIGHGEEAPDQLLANPRNWRIHPKEQQAALAGVLREVGVVQSVIVNKRTNFLVDGHLRVSLAMREGQPTVPCVYVDLTEEEEAKVLATIDPLSAMASTDQDILDDLLAEVSTQDAGLQALLDELAGDPPVPPDFQPAGEDEQGRLDEKAKHTCPECGHVF